MILSRKYGFVFIKGVKVGGTSMEVALSAALGDEDIITPIMPADEFYRLSAGYPGAQNYSGDREQEQAWLRDIAACGRQELARILMPEGNFYNHMGIREVEERHGAVPADWTVFCIERCPYRKIVSWANMVVAHGSYVQKGEMRAEPAALRRFLDEALEKEEFLTVRNIGRYTDGKGSFAPRVVLRYETLEDDFAKLAWQLGLPQDLRLPHLKKGLMSNTLDPKEMFSTRQLKIINDNFHEEFSRFGYAMAG